MIDISWIFVQVWSREDQQISQLSNAQVRKKTVLMVTSVAVRGRDFNFLIFTAIGMTV